MLKSKRLLILTLSLLLLFLLPVGHLSANAEEVIWEAEFFDNTNLSGLPVRAVRVPYIDYDWGYGSPFEGVPADHFSVRWNTDAYFEEGYYTFSVTVDDGIRFWIDGYTIIDRWQIQSATTYTARTYLSEGYHNLQVAYFEKTGAAVAKLWWRQDPSPKPPSPGPLPPPGHPPVDCHPPCYDHPPVPDCHPYCGEPVGYPPGHPDCHPQCPPSHPPVHQALIIDNSDPGFTWGGPSKYRSYAHGGFGPDFYWTKNTATSPINYGKWTPYIDQPGYYEIYVFVPHHSATTSSLRYRIMHHGTRHDKIIDQGWYNNEWVSLGRYYFSGRAGGEFVVAYDNTREHPNSAAVAFDAMKFVPVY